MDCSSARTRDPDEWIETAPPFSRPMAAQLREWLYRWEPDLNESIKWNMLCHSGRKLVCGISACRRHLGFSFFRGTELPDPARLFTPNDTNTNILSIRITSLDLVDPGALRQLVHAAAHLDSRSDLLPVSKAVRTPIPLPQDFAAALKRSKPARAFFDGLKPTYQREYIVWLTAVKRAETRERRLSEIIAALAAGLKWIDRKKALL